VHSTVTKGQAEGFDGSLIAKVSGDRRVAQNIEGPSRPLRFHKSNGACSPPPFIDNREEVPLYGNGDCRGFAIV
jgi:hypothetical protein